MDANEASTNEAATVSAKNVKTVRKQGSSKNRSSKGAAAKPAAKKPQQVKAVGKKATKAADSAPREGSKKAIVMDLLQREGGATMAEIAKATGWQKHSIRGFISGTLAKKMGLAVESIKNEAGDRVYRIAAK